MKSIETITVRFMEVNAQHKKLRNKTSLEVHSTTVDGEEIRIRLGFRKWPSTTILFILYCVLERIIRK